MSLGRAALGLLAALLAAPAAAQDGAALRWDGEWVGAYVCGQGKTGLTLRLRARGDGMLGGLFHFWPLPGNPGAAEGCFEMRATPRPGAPPALSLTAGRWLLEPPDYVTVDLEAWMGEDGQVFGNVDGPGCTVFSLRRASPPRPLPAACAGPLARQ
ncbi:hypothetical protein [Roseomonas sp. AR75]|uniref:hypothetical protein n=1 Tax=Roseomonas sp. AR75 TaxID=2562311 RepID=UPI0010BF85BC|nr:hypothetical protein [Roseomonas sp. AR75]